MTEPTKIEFRYRRIPQADDVTDWATMLFPGNRNQQHAAACILLKLKPADALIKSLSDLERQFGVSRRTLQRTRAKLARLGMIERVTWMNSRYGGQEGWKLSSRMSMGLRQLADKLDGWRKDTRRDRMEKDEALLHLLCPGEPVKSVGYRSANATIHNGGEE